MAIYFRVVLWVRLGVTVFCILALLRVTLGITAEEVKHRTQATSITCSSRAGTTFRRWTKLSFNEIIKPKFKPLLMPNTPEYTTHLGWAVSIDNTLTRMKFGWEPSDSHATDFVFHSLWHCHWKCYIFLTVTAMKQQFTQNSKLYNRMKVTGGPPSSPHRILWLFTDLSRSEIVPEWVLVLLRAGTTSLWSSHRTFFLLEPDRVRHFCQIFSI